MKVTAVVVGGVRLGFAVLGLVAVLTQLWVSIRNDFSIVNFFSYFTNLSNLVAATVLAVGAVRAFRGITPTRAWAAFRLVNVVNMAFVGLVFNILLTGGEVGALIPWVNLVVHLLVPIVVLADWLLVPTGTHPAWARAALGLPLPIAYSVYSLVRGSLTGFYPYPFYNADAVGGALGVVAYMVALVVALVVLSLVLVAVDRQRGVRR